MLIALARPDDAIVELEKLTEPRDAEAPRYLFALATAHVRAGHRDEGIKWATDAQQLALEHRADRARRRDRARSGATAMSRRDAVKPAVDASLRMRLSRVLRWRCGHRCDS